MKSVLESQGSSANRPVTLDHGCGQGTAVNFFHNQGCDAHGIDVSSIAISEGSNLYPQIAKKLYEVDPLLENFSLPDKKPSLITSIQTMYYLAPADRDLVMARLKELSQPNAIVYLTMMTSVGTYFDNSIELDNGMRHVKFIDDRISVDQHICFVNDENHFLKMFPMLEIIEIGQYLQSFRRSDFNHECTHLAITTRWR